MNELKTQYDMGAISIESIIDLSPYSMDTPLEFQRIKAEQGVEIFPQQGIQNFGQDKTQVTTMNNKI